MRNLPPDVHYEKAKANLGARPWDAVCHMMRRAVRDGPHRLPGRDPLLDHYPLQNRPVAPPAGEPLRRKSGYLAQRETWDLDLRYYGPAFQGSAWTPDALTVAGAMQDAITPLLPQGTSPNLSFGGRTDKGVSAVGAAASITSWYPLSEEQILDAVHTHAASIDGLPADAIRVARATRAPRSYHATFGQRWRHYAYFLPLLADDNFDADSISSQLAPLVGAPRDYMALGRGVPKGKSTVTELHYAGATAVQLDDNQPALRIDVVGNRFIRRQVRVLVATAVYAACHRADGDDAADGLLKMATSGRQEATAPVAPAEGLCFVRCSSDEWSYEHLRVPQGPP